MKVYINRTPIEGPWGGGNMWVKSMYDFMPNFGHQIVDIRKEHPDVIIIAGLSGDAQDISASHAIRYREWSRLRGKDVKLVLRVNENDARKNTKNVDSEIRQISRQCDLVIFVSKWLRDYFSPTDWGVSCQYVHNGVDSQIFKRHEKIKNDKINIVTHHWSDNYLKGFDVYDAIDKWIEGRSDFTFTYIGRDRKSFKNSKVVSPLFGYELGKELSKYDVYISASRYDPGPNHVIESISCGIPTYVHTDGGGSVEFAGLDHVYNDIDSLLNILENKLYHPNKEWTPPTWYDCIERYSTLIKEIR